MWFLDGRRVSDLLAATRQPEPIPYEEWLKLTIPLEGAGPAAERLRERLGILAEDAAPPKIQPES